MCQVSSARHFANLSIFKLYANALTKQAYLVY